MDRKIAEERIKNTNVKTGMRGETKEMEKYETKNNNGITLIALVITIIVLLVLAGVTIAMLTGNNGIITKAIEAKQQTTESAAKERVQTEVVGSFGIDGKISINELNKKLQNISELKYNGSLISDINKIISLPAIVELDGYKTVITPNGNVKEEITLESAKKYTMLDNEENSYINLTDGLVTIPAGFKVAEDSGTTIDEGIVIEDSKQNQFVWVPVSKENFETEFVRRKGYSNGSSQQDEFYYCGEADETGVNAKITETGTTQQEAKDMYASVKKNGGFYIGRYEAGKDSDEKVVIKKNANVYNKIPWSSTGNLQESEIATTGGAVELSRNFAKENNYKTVQSTLIYGVQWDATMNWMKDVENPNATGSLTKYYQDSTGMGWYNDDYSSGNLECKTGIDLNGGKNQVKKVYDLAGNVYEWTMESYKTAGRIRRGGRSQITGVETPASYRNYTPASQKYSDIGFRITLFLNN